MKGATFFLLGLILLPVARYLRERFRCWRLAREARVFRQMLNRLSDRAHKARWDKE